MRCEEILYKKFGLNLLLLLQLRKAGLDRFQVHTVAVALHRAFHEEEGFRRAIHLRDSLLANQIDHPDALVDEELRDVEDDARLIEGRYAEVSSYFPRVMDELPRDVERTETHVAEAMVLLFQKLRRVSLQRAERVWLTGRDDDDGHLAAEQRNPALEDVAALLEDPLRELWQD